MYRIIDKNGERIILIQLTCANKQEAELIRSTLLEKHLIACGKLSQVNSANWWEGKLENSDEILLSMESFLDKFSDIEATVSQLHSYDLYEMLALPIIQSNNGVREWIQESIT